MAKKAPSAFPEDNSNKNKTVTSNTNSIYEYRKEEDTMPKSLRNLIITGVLVALVVIGTLITVEMARIEGNQVGVKETWNGGVEEETLSPKMYFLFPGWSQNVYKYDMSPQIFVMNDRENDERANGRPNDSYIAKSSDNQQMKLWLALQWRYDQTKIINIHKQYKTHVGVDDWANIIEERLIRQVLMRDVNTEATKMKAIDAYSGEGFVSLQNAIGSRLMDPNGELRQQGIIVENFVIEQIHLDPEYIGEINKRQVAQQKTLRAQEEQKAALAEADKAKAEARANYEREVVAAELEKQKVVLKSEGAAKEQINAAEAAAQKQIIAAKADAEKQVIAANAEKEAAEARAKAIIAVGEAEGRAKSFQLGAYAEPGANVFAQIEISKNIAVAFQNIQGYLPSDMHINLLTENFMNSVQSLMGRNINNTIPKSIAAPVVPEVVNNSN